VGGEAFVLPFEELSLADTPSVGGKNSSLGEMIRELQDRGVRVPGGFATTARAYRVFLAENELEGPLREILDEMHEGEITLAQAGARIRDRIAEGTMPQAVSREIREAYRELSERYDAEELDVAVRSSATAEDLPEASFAGQQESFLNVTGDPGADH